MLVEKEDLYFQKVFQKRLDLAKFNQNLASGDYTSDSEEKHTHAPGDWRGRFS